MPRFFLLRRLLLRHPGWLLALALLLPLAQLAAGAHVFKHLQSSSIERTDGHGKATAAAGCEICLVAGAVSGGTPLPATPALPLLRSATGPAPIYSELPDVAPPPARYRSRAPPALPA